MWNTIKETTTEDEIISSKFCSKNILQICSEELAKEYPTVLARAHNKSIILSAGKSLILLENEENDTECRFLTFDATVEHFAVSDSGNLIICLLASGAVHGVYIKGVPVFTLSIQEEDVPMMSLQTFAGINQMNDLYYIQCCNGRLYTLGNLEECRLSESLANINENETYKFEDTILQNVFLDRLTLSKVYNGVSAFTMTVGFQTQKHEAVIGGLNFIAFVESDNSCKISLPNPLAGIKRMCNNGSFVIGLSANGMLFQICSYTKMLFPVHAKVDYFIEDFLVMEGNSEECELILIAKKDSESQNKLLKIIEFPSMQLLNEINLSESSWLVHQAKSSSNIYYATGEDFISNVPQSIVMKNFFETNPEERIKKLIQCGQLDLAEEFAKKHSLSLQPIHEARIKLNLLQIDELSRNKASSIEITNKFEDIIRLGKQITSQTFLLTLRSIEIPDRKLFYTFLTFLSEQLCQETQQSIVLEIKDQLLRLETLNLIDPYECNLEWQRFIIRPNFVKICTEMFKTDIPMACLVWRRHVTSLVGKLNIKMINELLGAIPNTTEPFNIILWLRNFVPSVLQIFPGHVSYLVDWSIGKTRSLQYSKFWPDIGLEFITDIFTIFDDIQFPFSNTQIPFENNLEKMQTLIRNLKQLATLKTNFNVILTLDDYMNDAMDETAFQVLQRIDFKNLKKFVNEFLYPIFMEKGLTPIDAIIRYIKFLVSNQHAFSFYQERVVASIELLHNEEERLQMALLVLKSAAVPWSDTLTPLINYTSSSHPLAAEIDTEYRLQVIKNIKSKYGWTISSVRDDPMKLVYRIVKVNLPEMMQDIAELVKAAPQIRLNAHFYCVYEVGRLGDIQRAVGYLNAFEQKDKEECSERLFNIITSILSEEMNDCEQNCNLRELLTAANERMQCIQNGSLNQLKQLKILQQQFGVDIAFEHLHCSGARHRAFEHGLQYIIDELSPTMDNILLKIWNSVGSLVGALEYERSFGLLEICKRLDNLALTCALANLLLQNCESCKENSEHLYEIAVLIVSQQITDVLNDTLSCDNPPAYPIAYQLLVECLQFVNESHDAVMELLRWVRIVYNLYPLDSAKNFYKDNPELSKKVCQSLLDPLGSTDKCNVKVKKRDSMSVFEIVKTEDELKRPSSDPEPIIKCISVTLVVLIKQFQLICSPYNCLAEFIGHPFETNTSEQLLIQFYKSLEVVMKLKQYRSAFMITEYILRHQENVKNSVITTEFVTSFHKKVLRRLLSNKDPDLNDALVVLLSDATPSGCLSYLETELKSGLQKVNYLKLSEIYHSFIGDIKKMEYEKENRMKYYYYTELCKNDASLKTKTNLKFLSITQLMKESQNKMLDVSLLEQLSREFGWDYQEVLVSQVITVLNIQELKHEVVNDALGREEIVIKTSTDQIRKLCDPYIKEITNMQLLGNKLRQFMEEINFYFYELYLVVLEILSEINSLPTNIELWSRILKFLKHKMTTKRRKKASQIETDFWLQSQTDIGVVPKISKYRFPFMPIVREPLKTILEHEICVENCEKWFPLIKLHSALNSAIGDISQLQDYFCMCAVKNSISEYKLNMENIKSDDWNLRPINNAFLQSIIRLIAHMRDRSKILFILYFATNNAPDGADQVEAAFECYQFALKHEKELAANQKAHETVTKIKRKYPLLKTQHLLHSYGLGEDKLFALMENPNELINALYRHEYILNPYKPDINKISKEIAELHNLNFNSIQMELLQKWLILDFDANATNCDETFSENLNTSDPDQIDYLDDFAVRSHYILSSWDKEKAVKFLILHIFPVGLANTGQQLKAFECFSKLMDDDQNDYKDLVTTNQYVIIKCIHYMKQLGISFTVDKFTEYDKLSLLKKLWQSHASNAKALEVMMFVCLEYNIEETQIWNGVLKQMASLNMVQELSRVLELLTTKRSLLYTSGLALAWECVVKAPFKSANRTRSYEQEQLLAKNLCLLQSCPIASKIDLNELAANCIRLKRPHMAAILIVIASKEQKDQILKMISEVKCDTLKNDIIELEAFGIAPIITKTALNELKL